MQFMQEVEFELGHELVRYSRVIHLLRTEMALVLPAGLDPAAGQLLAWLVKKGPSRQSELAEAAFLDPSTVSRRIAQLVSHGLAERRADPGDGRAIQLAPTARGAQIFTELRTRRDLLIHEVLTDWDPADVAQFRTLMAKFNDAFEAKYQL
jgi:DNA-binding MarR family transcriptional regulator